MVNTIDLDEIYEKIDNMCEKYKHMGKTEDYFPTVEELNTYAVQDPEGFIPFLVWLDDHMSTEARKEHREELKILYQLIEKYCEDEEIQ